MAHYDKLETRDPEERERWLFAHLPAYLEQTRERSPALEKRLEGISSGDIIDRRSLAGIPVLRKSGLAELQRAAPPFGGLAGVPLGQCGHVFASPGPLYEPAARRADYGAFARALFAAGFRPGDLVYNTFSYHFTPAGLMVDSAAQELGCAVFPAGVGQTDLQVGAIAHLRPAGYAGTPSFLKILLDRAHETAADVSSLTKGLVSAEALPATLRAQFGQRGIRVLQCYTTAELGVIAYESESLEGLTVNERLIVEIVRPGTDEPLPEGEVGEVVVTNLASPEYPLVRFGTGDLSAILPGTSPCGRTNMRIRGWLGRADQSAKIRGMFVHPGLIAQVLRRHRELLKARLVVRREGEADEMMLRCETESASVALADAVAASIREVCKVRGEVELVPPGSLPNDGTVIDDTRPVP